MVVASFLQISLPSMIMTYLQRHSNVQVRGKGIEDQAKSLLGGGGK